MLAAFNGHKDIVQLLADISADVNKVDNNGATGAREGGDDGVGRGHKQLTLMRGSTHGGIFLWGQGHRAAAGESRCRCTQGEQCRRDGCVRGRRRWGGEGAQAADTEAG